MWARTQLAGLAGDTPKEIRLTNPRRVFRAMVRDVVARDRLPAYRLEEEPGDMILATLKIRTIVEGSGLALKPETL